MKYYISFLVLILFFSCSSDLEVNISDNLRQGAIDSLQSVLKSELRWAKVHAAEYLTKLDYREGVDSVFQEENRENGEEPYYRIGIWRVLALSSNTESERNLWTGKIDNVYCDSLAKDRIHAIEAMAKLGLSSRCEVQDQTHVMHIFSSWADAYSTQDRKNQVVSEMLEIVESEGYTERERKLAVYVLRNLGAIGVDEWNRLVKLFLTDPKGPDFRVYLSSLCYVSAPPDSVLSENFTRVEKELLKYSDSDNLLYKRELALTLAEVGNTSHLELLVKMMRQQDGDSVEGLSDLRAAAACAILRIDRRQESHLSGLDWTVIFLYGALMLGIGFFYSKRNKTREDYLLGGRQMNSVIVGISLFATLLSTVSYLSYPGEMIKYGPVIFAGMLGFPLVYFVAGWWLIPRIMELKVTSAYEILELKLGLSVRVLAIFMFLSLRFLWMATIIYVTVDVALLSVVPIDRYYVPFISTLLLIITIVYTSMGGLKAVVLTDVIQSIVFLGGALISILIVSRHFGSLTSWFPDEWPSYWKPVRWGFDAQERTTIGNAVVMLFSWYICTTGSDQLAIQRYLSTRDIAAARKSLKVSLYTNLLAKCLLGLLGLAMFAFFSKNQHLLVDGRSFNEQADVLFPRFILLGLPIGLSGLVIAGLLAAAMSSLSSGLNSVSTVISEDIFSRFFPDRKIFSFNGSLKQVKRLSYITGFAVIGLSFFVGNVQGNLFDIVIKVTHLFVAPLFVLFFMALFVPFATEIGTLLGGIASIATAVSISFFGAFGITVLWVLPFSFAGGAICACLISFLEDVLIRDKQE